MMVKKILGVFSIGMVLMVGQSFAAPNCDNLLEGKDYSSLKPIGEMEPGVIYEFFSYSCPHCGEFEPHINGYVDKSKKKIVKVPVSFNDKWERTAKLYLALQDGQIEKKITPRLYEEAKKNQKVLYDDIELRKFLRAEGISEQQVVSILGAMNSFKTDAVVRKNKQLATALDIKSTPTIVYNGHVLDGKVITGFEDAIGKLNKLILNLGCKK